MNRQILSVLLKSDCRTTNLMSEEQLKAFIAKAKDDTSIQEKLKAAKTPDDVVGIAEEHGHEFTAEHMTELSEEELEGVAGGGVLGAVLFDCGLTLLADEGEGE